MEAEGNSKTHKFKNFVKSNYEIFQNLELLWRFEFWFCSQLSEFEQEIDGYFELSNQHFGQFFHKKFRNYGLFGPKVLLSANEF